MIDPKEISELELTEETSVLFPEDSPEVTISFPEERKPPQEEIAAAELPLPGEFTTDSGTKCRVKPEQDAQSGIQAVLYRNSYDATAVRLRKDREDSQLKLLQSMGMMEDEKGNECCELALPTDVVTLDEGNVWAIYLEKLTDTHQGLPGEAVPQGDIPGLYRCLTQQAQALAVAEHNGFYLAEAEGSHFFYRQRYGVLRIVLDGSGFYSGQLSEAQKKRSRDCVARHFRSQLEGFHKEHAPELVPENILQALENVDTLRPDGLAELLNKALEAMTPCPHCGKPAFAGVKRCASCGKTLDKKYFQPRLLIENDREPSRMHLIFSWGVKIPGKTLNPGLEEGAAMQLVYNSRVDAIGLRNLSRRSWRQLAPEEKTIAPNQVAVVQPGLILEPVAGCRITFERFEVTEP